MKIYKNPYTSYPCYLISFGGKIKSAHTLDKIHCYRIYFWNDEWKVDKSGYMYVKDLSDFPIAAENHKSIDTMINQFILNFVLDEIGEN